MSFSSKFMTYCTFWAFKIRRMDLVRWYLVWKSQKCDLELCRCCCYSHSMFIIHITLHSNEFFGKLIICFYVIRIQTGINSMCTFISWWLTCAKNICSITNSSRQHKYDETILEFALKIATSELLFRAHSSPIWDLNLKFQKKYKSADCLCVGISCSVVVFLCYYTEITLNACPFAWPNLSRNL